MTKEEAPGARGTPIRIWLELDLDAQPIEGTLTPSHGGPSRFVGWLGLTAALERLHRACTSRKEGDER